MVWRKPWQFAIYELEMWILGRSRDSWESKWRMNRDDKALKRPSKTWIILGRMWTFQSQYSSHRTSRYFPFIYRALKPSNIVECFSFCTVKEVSNINKAKRVLISCGHPSFGSAKESTLWHFWQYCETDARMRDLRLHCSKKNRIWQPIFSLQNNKHHSLGKGLVNLYYKIFETWLTAVTEM